MPDKTLSKLTHQNLLYMLQNLEGSELFRHVYVRRDTGEEFDAMDDGDLSCAFVVSGVLALIGLIDHPHATVQTTLQQMMAVGWYAIDAPIPGSVITWPAGVRGHTHIGFCIDEATYISNSSVDRHPVRHGKALADGRQPDGFYSHPSLV